MQLKPLSSVTDSVNQNGNGLLCEVEMKDWMPLWQLHKASCECFCSKEKETMEPQKS